MSKRQRDRILSRKIEIIQASHRLRGDWYQPLHVRTRLDELNRLLTD